MLDRNKTARTHRITADAIAYMDGHGFKPIETEVPVAQGWVADIASFACLSNTEKTNMGLIDKKVWPSGRKGIDQEAGMYFDFKYGPYVTMIIEVKISVKDFKKDLGYKFNGKVFPAQICAIAFPDGMLELKDIPDGWIGLPIDEDRRRVTKPLYGRKSWPEHYTHSQHPGDMVSFIANVAIRRDHRSRHESTRDWMKMQRARDKEIKKMSSLNQILEGFLGWMGIGHRFTIKHLKDKTFDEMYKYYTRKDMPGYLKDRAPDVEKVRELIRKHGLDVEVCDE